MWPQLRHILQGYLASLEGPPGQLLFPSPRGAKKKASDEEAEAKETMMTDVRNLQVETMALSDGEREHLERRLK